MVNVLQSLERQKNLPQEDLAVQIDSSRVKFGKYECEDNLPSLEVIVKLAKTHNRLAEFLLE